ncbi:HAD family hydrolase [Photobacterium iliopiscarium]|uniref:Cof-type HAD-IIB family hydrolase n=1 Tax=Photobacterium iliopiscarium TaxID=56192 RepID=A0ABX5GWG5_9GAMM|nr:sugar-phosphatase [Photobacterium iliopiscarium]KJG21103.1 HAD family hydrolase [Photobacterium iliopiscarium]PSW99213.1 Cof-type HAD-IIB family hydrolase [Photobacterium iliopiscarium]
MYKLVALDMDGTLLSSDGTISAHNKQAIAAAREQGTYVVLASGRPIEGMTWALKELNMDSDNDFVLSYNASLVQRVASQEVVRSQTLIGSDAKAISAIAQDLGVHVHAFSRRQGLITPEHNYYTDHEAKINGLTITLADFSELDDNEEIMKVMIIDEEDRLEAAIAQLPATLYQQYTIVRSAPFFLEFMHTNSNKGVGVKALADFLNIKQDEVIAMGDAGNDHHMIEFAGLGVAMGNATEATKAIANYITDTNNNSGVAQVIEKFIINA